MLAGLNTGALVGLFLVVKKFLGSFGQNGGLSDILDTFSEGIENITGVFGTMQNTLKAATLLQIALAIGVLAVSINILSKIDAEGLSRASAAITVMFGQLLGSLAVFQKFIGAAGFAKLPFVMGSLILLAAAVLILTQAVKQLAGLSWNELSKGLTGLAVTLGLVVGALKFMPPASGLISTGLGLIALGAAIKILVSAVSDLSGLSWQDLAKGLVGVGAILGALVLFTMFAKADAGGIAQGAGIILLASGIKILASAVADMSKMSWNEIAKGLVTLAGALAIITGALMLIPPTAGLSALGVLGVALSLGMIAKALDSLAKMSWANIGSSLTVMLGALAIIAAALYVIPPTAPLSAAGILLVAISLQQIAKVLSDFAAYSWEEIGKAMVLLAGTLGLIAGAMLLMTGALPGAAATLIVAAALTILAPVLQKFGDMSLAEIGKSLLMLAGFFVVFGAAALLLTPVVPVMIALAGAVLLLGAGMLAAGAGIFLFATALTALAAAGAAGTAAIVGIVAGLIALIPEVMKQIGLGLVAFAQVIATAGPAILQAMVTVISSMISAIVKLTPKIVTALLSMLAMLLSKLAQYVPKLVSSGARLITGILNGIAANVGKMVTAATNVVVNFLNGISKNQARIIDAGVKLIISFINGVAKAINANSAALGAAGGRLGVAIIQGMAKGILGGIGQITSAARSVAGSALSAAKNALGIHSPSKAFEEIGKYVIAGFRNGLDGDKASVVKSMTDLATKLKTAMTSSAKDVDTLEAKLKRLTSARSRDNAEIKKTRAALAQAKKEHAAEAKAYTAVTKSLKNSSTALGKLADKQAAINTKLAAAQQSLADLIKTRADFKAQITDQYDNLPDITPETNVAGYEADLKTQIEKTKEFSNTLQRLRDLGLSDAAYSQLLAKGIDALPFANELLSGGKDAINTVNDLDKQLATASAALGKQASSELYDAAVNAAAGLVKGLEAQQKAIEKQMDKIADYMVKAIKKALGIKSPSKVFMGIGKYSGDGLVEGLDQMSGVVGKSASSMGTTAMEALRKSLSNVTDMVTSDVNFSPVITPVLDLSSVKKDAGQISKLVTPESISIDSSYAKAAYVASNYASNMAAAQQGTDPPGSGSTLNYTQNNYSPKALSPADIYRQTNNQLSKAKGALARNAVQSGSNQ